MYPVVLLWMGGGCILSYCYGWEEDVSWRRIVMDGRRMYSVVLLWMGGGCILVSYCYGWEEDVFWRVVMDGRRMYSGVVLLWMGGGCILASYCYGWEEDVFWRLIVMDGRRMYSGVLLLWMGGGCKNSLISPYNHTRHPAIILQMSNPEITLHLPLSLRVLTEIFIVLAFGMETAVAGTVSCE